jgi:hypothetical protein
MRVTSAIAAFAPWRKVLRELLWATGTGIVSLIAGAVTLGINVTTLGMRWQTNIADDQTQHYLVAKAIADGSLIGNNDRMGFPTHQNLFFTPNYDPASAIFMMFQSLFTDDGVLILNVYHLLGFFSVAFAGYFLFKALRVRRFIAIFFALVFALAPFHFQRVGFGHGFVANYWAIALVGILILMSAGPKTDPFEGWVRNGETRAMRAWRRWLPIVTITLLVSLSLSYYFVFAALILAPLLAVRAVIVLAEREKLRTLLWPFVTLASLLLFVGVQLAILSLDFGDRYAQYFGERSAFESEIHAGKITTLILPWIGTGFTALGNITRVYIGGSDVSIFAEPPGSPIVAAGGMILIVIFVLVRLMHTRTGESPTALGRFIKDDRANVFAAAFFWGLLFFTVSGLGAIFSFVVSPEIRAWVRMSIVLVMLALGFFAVFIDRVIKPLKLAIPVIAFLALIAVVDQLVGVHTAVDLQATDDASLRSFVSDAEQLLDDDCGVVQLPLHAYPATGPVGAMSDYNQSLPYTLATDNSLRWSYGAVVGTKAGDYWENVTTPAEFESKIVDSGACAIEVDLAAYPDDQSARRDLVATVADPDDPAIVSDDDEHRYLLFTVDAR